MTSITGTASSRASVSALRSAGPDLGRNDALPETLAGLVIRTSGWHQLSATSMAVLVFLLSTVPIDLQRRIVNGAVEDGSARSLLLISGLYLGAGLGTGFLKLGLNFYRGWISESATRWLRLWCLRAASEPRRDRTADVEGVEISIVVAESEPVGAFIGNSISEPVLQLGLLLTIFGYLAYLQPLIAALSFAVLLPQFVFVPLMQQAINRRIGLRIVELRSVSIRIVSQALDLAESAASIDRVLRINMSIYGLKFSMNFFMNSLHHLGITAVLAVGGYYVLNGWTEVGTVVAFISGLVKLNDPWGDLVDWFRDFLAARAKFQLIVQSSLVRADYAEAPGCSDVDSGSGGRARAPTPSHSAISTTGEGAAV